MNEMLKFSRQTSSKTKTSAVPRSPENTLKQSPKKSLTINSVITTPKLHTNDNHSKQAYNTNAVDLKAKQTPKAPRVLMQTEKKNEIKLKMGSSNSNNNMLAKKSQSQSKETKPPINSVFFKENQTKLKPEVLQLTEEEKSYLSSLDCMKTPKKISTNNNNIMSSFTTPKNTNTPVTNRFTFSPSNDHSKVLNLLSTNNNVSISANNLKLYNPQNYQPSKCSNKSLEFVKAYSANTNQGIIRVSIILNIVKPSTYTGNDWPKCSFFAVYDGHGGSLCADFLRDNLHNYIIKSHKFPSNVKEAINEGFEKAEKEFINNYSLNSLKTELVDKSGSCALIAMIVDDECYLANVGDSRAVISRNGGKSYAPLTVDHKPNDAVESKRIVENGGKVYQTKTVAKTFTFGAPQNNQLLVGPYRVLPGRLSVSRTFGDAEAKLSRFGGNERVIVATPDVTSFKIDSEVDFIVLGCDGIFDQLSDQEVIECVWLSIQESIRGKNIHLQCGIAVDLIIKSSLLRKTLDNVTCVLIVFENFERCYNNNLSNFNFSTINSNMSTFNTLNTPNNKGNYNYHENREKEDSSHNSKSSITTNLSNNNYNTEIISKQTDNSLQISACVSSESNSFNTRTKSNISYQENLPNKSTSPLRIRSAKANGLRLAPPNEFQRYLSKGKCEKTVELNLANYISNCQKAQTPGRVKLNMSEDTKLNHFGIKNVKKIESASKNKK